MKYIMCHLHVGRVDFVPATEKNLQKTYNTQKKHLQSVIIHNIRHKLCHAYVVMLQKNKYINILLQIKNNY